MVFSKAASCACSGASTPIIPPLRYILLMSVSPFLCAPSSAWADDISSSETLFEMSDRVSYAPTYFQQYNPLTAADMVNQLPGFNLIEESGDRGFGQGQGNLLINGKRPSTKSNKPEELLKRIAAETVVRIEVLREGSSELSGQSGLIANVITDSESSLSGSYLAGVYFHEEGMVRPEARLSIGGNIDNFSYNVDLSLDVWKHEESGEENVRNADFNLTEIRAEQRNVHNRTPKLNINLGWNGDNGDVANLSLQAFYYKHNFHETSDQFMAQGTVAGDLLRMIETRSGEDEYTYEIGGDYTTDFAGGSLKFIGLRRREDSRFFTHYDDTAEDGSFFRYNSRRQPIESETILRTLYTTEPTTGHVLEWAIEGAFNTLDTTATFQEDTGSGFQDVLLSGSNTRVEERRAESSLLYVLPLGKKLRFQTSVAVEYSELSVSGNDNNTRSYVRPKGFAALTFDATVETQFRGRIDRKVGQLNFFDFASRRDISQGQTDSGNTELVPEQLWRFELTAEHRFSPKNVTTLTAYYETFEDYNMLVPLAGGGQGIGNVDGAKNKGITLTSTWMLDSLGVNGGKLDFAGTYQDSEIKDPFTGIFRHFDWQEQWQIEITFRQDIQNTNWAWGLNYWDNTELPGYRKDRINKGPFGPNYFAYVEHKDVLGMTLTAKYYNAFGRTMQYNREFFAPDRLGGFDGGEFRSLRRGGYFNIQLAGKF